MPIRKPASAAMLALLLAACSSTGGMTTAEDKPADETPAATAPAAAAPAAAPAAPASRSARNLPAARAAAAASAPKPDPAEAPVEEPLDQATASGRCWMQADKKSLSLEAKAKFVDKCVDDMMAADRNKQTRMR